MAQQKDPFQLIDLHIHLKGGFTIADAISKSEKENVKYGIAVNGGIGFSVQNDYQLDSVISVMKNYPQFFIGMQAEVQADTAQIKIQITDQLYR